MVLGTVRCSSPIYPPPHTPSLALCVFWIVVQLDWWYGHVCGISLHAHIMIYHCRDAVFGKDDMFCRKLWQKNLYVGLSSVLAPCWYCSADSVFFRVVTQFRASTVQVLNGLSWQTVHMFELHARKAESIAGTKLATLEEVVGDRMLVRLLAIKADSHPSVTHWTIGILEPYCQRECYRRSFLPAAIRLFHLSTYSPPSLPHLTVLCHFCTPWHVFAIFYIYILIFLPFFSFY